MVGGGVKTLEQSRRAMNEVMPKRVTWYQTSVGKFEPEQNMICTTDGSEIRYEYLIVGVGLQVNFDKVG